MLLLNVLFRIGVQGDVERDREDEARAYFAEHGKWPHEDDRPAGRRWNLPEGVATPSRRPSTLVRAQQKDPVRASADSGP